MVIPPLYNRNSFNGYINPYYWVDDHPLLYGNNESLDSDPHKVMPHPLVRGHNSIDNMQHMGAYTLAQVIPVQPNHPGLWSPRGGSGNRHLRFLQRDWDGQSINPPAATSNARAVLHHKKETTFAKLNTRNMQQVFGQDKVEPFSFLFSLHTSLETLVKNAFASNPKKNKRSSLRGFSSKFEGDSPKNDIHLQVYSCLHQNSNRLPKTSSKSWKMALYRMETSPESSFKNVPESSLNPLARLAAQSRDGALREGPPGPGLWCGKRGKQIDTVDICSIYIYVV